MSAVKARSCSLLMYGWQSKISYKRSQIKAKQTEIKPEKDRRLRSFSCLIIITMTNRQTDMQKSKIRGV